MLGVIVGPHATHDYVGAPTPPLDYFVRPITRLVRHTHHDIVRGIGLGALDRLVSPVCLLEHEDKRRPRRRRTGLPDDGLATASIHGGETLMRFRSCYIQSLVRLYSPPLAQKHLATASTRYDAASAGRCLSKQCCGEAKPPSPHVSEQRNFHALSLRVPALMVAYDCCSLIERTATGRKKRKIFFRSWPPMGYTPCL